MASAAAGPVDLGHRDRPVERDHRARRDGQQLVVQRQDLGPVGGGRDGRVAVHGVDRGLDLVRARLAAAQALPDEGLALGDQRAVPARPVLVGEQHQRAVRGRAGRPPRLGEQHQREQPEHLGLVRHELGQQPPEPDRLGAQVGAGQRLARARRVALVEDEVDDGEHAGKPGGQVGLRRDAVRDPGVPDLGLGPDQPLGHGRFRHQEGARDLGRGEPAEQPERQRHLGGRAERRVAAGEDEPQPVVAHRALLHRLVLAACSSAAWACLPSRAASRRSRSMARLRAVVMIHPAGLGGSPADGHRLAASANASWTASSAMSMSPKTRVRTATARPYSVAEDALDVGERGRGPGHGHGQPSAMSDHRPDLDRQLARGRGLARPGERGVQVGRPDDPEPADVLLALGERPVGDEHVAAVRPQHGGRVRRVQAAGEDPGARRLHLGVHRVDVAHDRLEDLRRRRIPVRLVDAEQVLLHLGHPPDATPAGSLHPLHEPPGADRQRPGTTRNPAPRGRIPRSPC